MLTLTRVSKRFGGVTALRALDLHVHAGEVVGLIGPNGAGKTTVFNIITGLYRPSEGAVAFEGHALTHLSPAQITRLGIARTFQNVRLFPSMAVWEHILVAQNLRAGAHVLTPFVGPGERARREEGEELLDLFGLAAWRARRAMTLPFAAQRRLEIARALATRPRLLLLDEPAAGMGQAEAVALLGALAKVRARGISLLLIEHDMSVVMGLCDRIIVLDFGEKIAEGTAAEVQANERVLEAYLGQEP